MDQRAAYTTGLEFLGKLFALHDNNLAYRRAAYAPLFQTDGLYDRQLEQVPAAFRALESGDSDFARRVLNGVVQAEATERAMSNFAPTFQAHHGVSMGGLALLTPDMHMEDSFKVRDGINDAGIYTGTNRHKLLSGSSTFFHPAAHTNPETQTTGGYKAGQKVLSKFRQLDPTERLRAALGALQWENDTSYAAHKLQGEQAIRESVSKLAGIPLEEMMSTEADTSLRKGAKRTKAASSTINLKPKASLIQGIVDEVGRQYSNELYIPVMYKQEHKSRPGVFSDWRLAKDVQEKDYMDEYLRTERPGLGEAIEQIMSENSKMPSVNFIETGPGNLNINARASRRR